MGLSKPISEMSDAEVLEEIRSLRERRAGRAAELAAKRVAAATAAKLPKERKAKVEDDAIQALLRNILAEELGLEPKKE